MSEIKARTPNPCYLCKPPHGCYRCSSELLQTTALPVTNAAVGAVYSHVWSNRLGEYHLSNSASYNPNVGSNIQWQEMRK